MPEVNLQGATTNRAETWDEAAWDALRKAHFPFARINLNPGTLTSPSKEILAAVQDILEPLQGFPLGMYQAGRAALQEARSLAQEIWPSATHDLAIGPPMTTAANLWTHALAAHWPHKPTIKVLSTHHEHYGCLSSFAHHPRMQVTLLNAEELSSEAAFAAKVQALQPDLAIFSDITYGLGQRLPVVRWDAQLQASCPDCIVMIDVAHTIGQCDLPLPAGDIVLGSTHKWLCGPSEVGLTWLRRERQALLPPLFLTDHALDQEHPASCYEISGGQRFAKYLELEQTLRFLLTCTPQRIYQRTQQLASYFAEGYQARFGHLASIQIEVSDCAMVLLHFVEADPYPIYQELNARGVHVKCMKDPCGPARTLNLLRLGFPFYETLERLEQVLDIFDECSRSLV